jgi:hypothetical protein
LPSRAVQAVPVLFDAGTEPGDDALRNPSSVGENCGPGSLSLHAGIEPCELVVAKADGGVEASSFGGDMVLPTLAGVGLTFSPGSDLFGGGAPHPPVRGLLSFPSGASHARLGSNEVGGGLAGLGAEIDAPPGQEVSLSLFGLFERRPGLRQLGAEIRGLQVTDGFCGSARSGQGQGDDAGVVRSGQRDDGFLDEYRR